MLSITALLCSIGSGSSALAQGRLRPKRVLPAEISSRLQLSVDRGLDYLVSKQTRSGAIGSEFPVAVSALTGLAFLAGGKSQEVGEHGESFARLTRYLLDRQTSAGYFKDGNSRMYGHGFATLFFAELYGMAGALDPEIHRKLRSAVALIERAQSPDGGWDYEPVVDRGGDTSITVCQTMALRAARNLGLVVNPSVVARAKGFVLKAQNSIDGSFVYRLRGLASFGDPFPRSAAGVCVLLSLGDYSSGAVEKGFDYLERGARRTQQIFPFYADYYCALAMFQGGRRRWDSYFPAVRDRLIGSQRSNGSWKGDPGGPEQSTAMALIVLQVPYRYLPIIER